MGSIFWQLNDCWPVASWSSIDYYGRWKALQYYARRFYAPVLVSPHVEDGTLSIYVVSDRTKPESSNLHLRIMHFDGSVVKEIRQTVDVAPLASAVYLKVPLADLKEQDGKTVDLTKVFASVELTAEGETPSSNIAYFVPTKQVKLPQPGITTILTKDGTGYDLELKSAALARSVYIAFDHVNAQLSDNYVDLLPGQPVRLHIKSDAGLNQVKSEMKVVSLVDAFAPSAEAHEGHSGH